MTIIEFFDRSIIKNVANALLCNPDRVITVGHDTKLIHDGYEYLRPLIENRETKTELLAMQADRNDVNEIISVLEGIVKKYDDCVFDLTGGEDLYLVAVGSIMAKYKVQCHRLDFKKQKLIDCDADGCVCKIDSFDVSVEDLIMLHGGKIVDNPYDRYYQEPWVLDGFLREDVDVMWECMKEHEHSLPSPGAWNATMTCIGAACSRMKEPDSLSVSFNLNDIGASIESTPGRYLFVPWVMKNLSRERMIEYYERRGNNISFRFKNRNVKRIMTKAGQLLELRTAFALAALRDEQKKPAFHDIRVGVVIDWDPDSARAFDENRSVNEIDIVAMYGAIPIFVSCKNGSFNSEELYKFNTVAELFGSELVKKIMVTADMDASCSDPLTLRERMDEMGIKRVERVHQRNESSLSRVLCGLCGICS